MNKVKTFMCNHFKQAKHSFNLDESAYSLIFGLAPSAWDIVTDIKLGFDLERNGNVQESGLCFLIISNPGIIILWDTVWRHIAPKRPGLVITLVVNCIFLLVIFLPCIFKYSAVIVSIFILIVKTIAVFVHTSEMKKFSQKLSEHECTYESSFQILILLHIWLSTGKLYFFTLVSSVLNIGKVAAESYLIKGRQNKLKNKPIFEKILLVVKYIPVMSITAIFRLGCLMLFLFPPSLFFPVSLIPSFIILDLFYLLPYLLLSFLILNLLKLWCSSISRLSGFEMFQALSGELITITICLS
jgi:hypothetical protein